MKIYDILKEADEGLPPTIKPLQIPPFPEMPQQDGELGDGSTAGSFTKPFPGKYLSGVHGKFIWNAKGEPTEWHAPNFGGMTQRYNIKTGDITVRLQDGSLDVSAVYDKTGKLKPGQGNMSYDMGTAKVSKGPQGNTITVRGGAKDGSQDQTVGVESTTNEITLGDYRKKAQMAKAMGQMDAVFGRSPEEKEKGAKTATKREKGLDRLRSRDEKRAAGANAKAQADALAKDKENLPQLKSLLQKLEAEFDPYYEYSDDHSFWSKQKDIAAKIASVSQRIKRAQES